jgi:hypothetical protein
MTITTPAAPLRCSSGILGQDALGRVRPGVEAQRHLVAGKRDDVVVDQVAPALAGAHQASLAAFGNLEASEVAGAAGLERGALMPVDKAMEHQRLHLRVLRGQRRGVGVEFGTADIADGGEQLVQAVDGVGGVAEAALDRGKAALGGLHEIGAGALVLDVAHARIEHGRDGHAGQQREDRERRGQTQAGASQPAPNHLPHRANGSSNPKPDPPPSAFMGAGPRRAWRAPAGSAPAWHTAVD